MRHGADLSDSPAPDPSRRAPDAEVFAVDRSAGGDGGVVSRGRVRHPEVETAVKSFSNPLIA